MPAWALTIASGGLKIKPVKTDAVDNSGFVNTIVKDGGACEVPPTVAPGQPRLVGRPSQESASRLCPRHREDGDHPVSQFRRRAARREADLRHIQQRNGPNQVVVAGGVTLEALARSLASPLGGIVVTDKTANTDKFNIVLEYVRTRTRRVRVF
jgi:uncharacterized protein (TIGR03435 family)